MQQPALERMSRAMVSINMGAEGVFVTSRLQLAVAGVPHDKIHGGECFGVGLEYTIQAALGAMAR